jgi:ubiquinone/menaquinone biosynthesis C-methylase UbiE
MLEFDEATAKALERIYGTRDVLRRRQLVQEALAARPGEHLLDMGCGPGFYVAELVEQVGPDGLRLLVVGGVPGGPYTRAEIFSKGGPDPTAR